MLKAVEKLANQIPAEVLGNSGFSRMVSIVERFASATPLPGRYAISWEQVVNGSVNLLFNDPLHGLNDV